MVLISIHPFAFRKIFLVALAVLGLSSAFCFADPVFMTSRYAPPHDSSRGAESAKIAAANLNRSALVRPSFEALLAHPQDVESITVVRFWDATRTERPSGFSRTAAASVGAPACLRYGIDPNFTLVALESLTDGF